MEGFKTLKGAGVNRISLGVQSFNDEELATIGRIHSPEEAVRAVYFVREAGIENISLDFMFSLPGQTEKSLTETLQKAVSLKPDHLSCYSLTLCEGTPLKNLVDCGELSLPDEDADRALYHFATDFLEKNGYERYEISNFSKPGREARHNTKYWNREAYIGLGAAAHSFYQNYRYENPPSLAAYYDRVSQKLRPEGVFITNDEAMAEFVFLGLRQTKKGICRSEFNTIFHTDFNEHYHKAVEKLTHLGLLTDDGERIILTPQGIDVSNAVFCEFL